MDTCLVGKKFVNSVRELFIPLGDFYLRRCNWNQWRHDGFERSGPSLVIIGGMMTFRTSLLDPMLYWYLTRGYNAYALAPMSFVHYRQNLLYLDQELQSIEQINRDFRESDEIILVGYSMGGVLSFMLSMESERWSSRIVKVVSLATPFTGGIADPFFKEFVFRHTGISESLWHTHDRDGAATEHANRVLINVASSTDTTAPYSHCYIPTSTCTQVDVTLERDERLRSVDHLHFITRHTVHALIQQKIEQEV